MGRSTASRMSVHIGEHPCIKGKPSLNSYSMQNVSLPLAHERANTLGHIRAAFSEILSKWKPGCICSNTAVQMRFLE